MSIPFKEIKKEMMKDPIFKKEYDALEDEFLQASNEIVLHKANVHSSFLNAFLFGGTVGIGDL